MKASKFLRLKAKKEQSTKAQPVVQALPVAAKPVEEPVIAPAPIVEPVVEEVKVEKVETPVTKSSLASKAAKKKTDEQLTE